MKLKCVGMTDVGFIRQHNEDDFYISNGEATLCIVVDAVGGSTSGEIAATILINSITEYFRKTNGGPLRLLHANAIQHANKDLRNFIAENQRYAGMGATMVSSFFTEKGVHLAHVGDARAYRFRSGILEQKTTDHSLLNDYISKGLLSPEEIENFPHKNVVVRACGVTDEIEVETSFHEIETGDLYLLCSDGLTDMLSDVELAEILGVFDGDLEGLCQTLIDHANANGGHDNITVILAQIEDV